MDYITATWKENLLVPTCYANYCVVISVAIMSQAAIRMSGTNSGESLDAVIIRASQRLGYSSVRDKQLLAIRTFMESNDVFISLPTGNGKSLCYAVLHF